MIANRSLSGGTSVRSGAALFLLGFLGSASTLCAELAPGLFSDRLPPRERQIVSLALFTLVAAVIAVLRKHPWPRRSSLKASLLLGLGLFALPSLLGAITTASVPIVTRAALYTLVPMFAVVLEPYLAEDLIQQPRGALLAALTSVAGTLLVLPVTLPDSLQAAVSWLALLAAAACTAAVSCLGFRATSVLIEPAKTTGIFAIAPFAAVSGITALLGLAVLAAFAGTTPWSWSALPSTLAWSGAIELPTLLLLFWLLPRLSAPRITTRFTLSLLFPILIGVPLLGAHLSLRAWSGIALMSAGTAYLLFAPQQPAESGLSLR